MLRQRADRKLIETGFDRQWYLDRNPDVRAAKVDPVSHFLKWGAREGRDPNPLFWTRYYLTQNPGAGDAGCNPLLHYLRWGWREGRDPNPLFDSDWYLHQNEDVAAAGTNPLIHYLRQGAAGGRDPHPLFNTAWYLEENPEIRGAGANPLQHFLFVGARTGCNPHPLFDSLFYLERNPDVQDAGLNPLVHYLEFGVSERRNPNSWFDNESYMARYPDVRESGLNPLVHYRLHGITQGRDASPRTVSRPDPISAELSPAALFDVFQSVGDNCEFGLVQRYHRSNLLGLFKFASTGIDHVISALRARFRDLASPEHIDIQVRFKGSKDGPGEFYVASNPYGFLFHAGLKTVVEARKFRITEARRLEFLVRGFIEHLEKGEKIFVYKSNQTAAQARVEELFAAMRAYGQVTLLWVTVASHDRPAGTVEEISDGLLHGYIDRLAPYENVDDYSAEGWKTVCTNAYACWLRRRNPTRKTATASEDIEACDSLRRVEMLLNAEEEFNIQFAAREIDELQNFDDLARLIREKSKPAD
jgi:acyl carrier protein